MLYLGLGRAALSWYRAPVSHQFSKLALFYYMFDSILKIVGIRLENVIQGSLYIVLQ